MPTNQNPTPHGISLYCLMPAKTTHPCNRLVKQYLKLVSLTVVRGVMILQKTSQRRILKAVLQHLRALVVVTDKLSVNIHVRHEGQQELSEANTRLGEGFLELRAEHLVQHQKTLAVNKSGAHKGS